MSVLEKALVPENPAGPVLTDEDRRDNRRDRIFKEVSLQSLDASKPKEIAMVIDLSRTGLYVTVGSYYEVGTPLRLVFADSRSECLCEVVRIKILPQGRFGIGARILSW